MQDLSLAEIRHILIVDSMSKGMQRADAEDLASDTFLDLLRLRSVIPRNIAFVRQKQRWLAFRKWRASRTNRRLGESVELDEALNVASNEPTPDEEIDRSALSSALNGAHAESLFPEHGHRSNRERTRLTRARISARKQLPVWVKEFLPY